MLKKILKLGKVLDKAQQKEVSGGIVFDCSGQPNGTPCWHINCSAGGAWCLNGFCGY